MYIRHCPQINFTFQEDNDPIRASRQQVNVSLDALVRRHKLKGQPFGHHSQC